MWAERRAMIRPDSRHPPPQIRGMRKQGGARLFLAYCALIAGLHVFFSTLWVACIEDVHIPSRNLGFLRLPLMSHQISFPIPRQCPTSSSSRRRLTKLDFLVSTNQTLVQ